MRGPGGIAVPRFSSSGISQRRAQVMRSKAAKVGRPTRQYLLTGRLWCAQCGRRCCTSISAPEPYYRCGNIDYNIQLRRGCDALGVRQSQIEKAVWEETWGALADPETLYGLIVAYRARLR